MIFLLSIFAGMQSPISNSSDMLLLKAMRSGSTKAFALLFNKYYSDLVLYCGTFLQDLTACEDIVQNTFLKLWECRQESDISSSLRAYLIRCARNMCLDELRHRHVKTKYLNSELSRIEDNGKDYTENYILYSELESLLTAAIQRLPEKEKEAFVMSRINDLKYKQIAQILGVSQRTVEVRISNALKILKKIFSEY